MASSMTDPDIRPCLVANDDHLHQLLLLKDDHDLALINLLGIPQSQLLQRVEMLSLSR
jgi:hypothetical protein